MLSKLTFFTNIMKLDQGPSFLPQWFRKPYSSLLLNPLPNGKILNVTKFKAFADDKFSVARMTFSLPDTVENTVEKRSKIWLPAFSPFPTVFSKAFFFGGC